MSTQRYKYKLKFDFIRLPHADCKKLNLVSLKFNLTCKMKSPLVYESTPDRLLSYVCGHDSACVHIVINCRTLSV